MAVSLSCAVPEPLKPPVGIRPRLSTVVWAMAMGENEEVGCLWFVECGVWFVTYLFVSYLFILRFVIVVVTCDL